MSAGMRAKLKLEQSNSISQVREPVGRSPAEVYEETRQMLGTMRLPEPVETPMEGARRILGKMTLPAPRV